MIEFRQKVFTKRLPKFKPKEVKNWAVHQIKENTNPLMLGVSAAGAGLGVANVKINKQRRDADIKLREDQIKATNELTEVLHKIEGLDKKEARKQSKKIKAAFRKQVPEVEHPSAEMQLANKTIFREKKK